MKLLDRARLAASVVFNPQNLSVGTSRQLYDEMLLRNGETDGGIVVTPELAMRLATVYSCVRVLSEDIAKLPLKLYQRMDRGKKLVTDHWLADLLEQPNQWQTGYEFREMMQAHVELTGNAYALKTVVRNEVRELLPVVPSRMEVTMLPGYKLQYKLSKPDGTIQYLTPDQVYHERGLSLNGYQGVSPVSYQRETMGMGLQMMKYGARLFKNGAMIGGMLKHPGEMSEPAYERLKASFEEKYSGVDNAHKVILLEEGAEFIATGMKADDAQFLESRKMSRAEIAGIYRVPPHMVGDLERATFSNIEQQSRDYVQNGLLPRLARKEARMALSLLSDKDRKTYFVEHLVDFLMRGDYINRMQGYKIAVTTGWMSRNEVRVIENMNPEDGLDEFLQPQTTGTPEVPNGDEPVPGADPAKPDAPPSDPAKK